MSQTLGMGRFSGRCSLYGSYISVQGTESHLTRMNLNLAFVLRSVFFKKNTLYFGMILNFMNVAKVVQNSHTPYAYLTWMLTTYITIVRYQNQEINVGAVLRTKLQTLFRFHQFFPTLPPPGHSNAEAHRTSIVVPPLSLPILVVLVFPSVSGLQHLDGTTQFFCSPYVFS